MSPRVILDTGPLIAYLNSRDWRDEWVRKQWARLKPPFLTSEAVIRRGLFSGSSPRFLGG